MTDFLTPMFGADTLFGLLLDVSIRGSLLLGLVAGLAVLLRDRSAAVRHVLWTIGILGFLALPALSAKLPWKLEILPARASAATLAASPAAEDALRAETPRTVRAAAQDPLADAAGGPPDQDPAQAGTRSGPAGDAQPSQPDVEEATPAAGGGRSARGEGGIGERGDPAAGATANAAAFDGTEILLALWALGALLLALRLAVGSVRVRRLIARGRELTDEDSEREVFHLARRLDIGSYVRVVESEELSMPITAGITRPTIVLPAGFGDWSEDRLRAVILHELAHIHRRDILSHMISRVTCALHWFNPLAWHSAARLRTESERACDDMVLEAGTRASAYADHLLSILRSCSTVPSPATAIPMARRTEFEGRLLAILEPDARRAAAGRTTVLAMAAAVTLIALPLAALAPSSGRGQPDGAEGPLMAETDAGGGGESGARAPSDPEGDIAGNADADADTGANANTDAAIDDAWKAALDTGVDADVEKDAVSSGRKTVGAVLDGIARAAAGATVAALEDLFTQEPQSQEETAARLSAALGQVLAEDPERDIRRAAAVALGDAEDPRAVAALSRALENDPDASVRRAAAWALGEIESPLGIPALARAARQDESQEVRAMAVWALGEIEHPDAIPALSEVATSGATPELRKRAVWGLGEIEHPRAIPTLSSIATSNAPMDIRRMAVWGLGEIEHPDAIPTLGRLIREGNADLRSMAIWALGEIEHPDGVQYLGAAVSDPDPNVRRRAVWALGQIESERGVDAVAEALDDDDARIRSLAVWALGEIESPRAVPHLTPLLRDRNADVRRRAAWALGEIESPDATQALSGIAGDGDLAVRKTVIWALGEIEDPAGVPALRRALGDDDREIRFLALKGLADIESDAAVEAILDALESGDPEMRRAATAALGRGGSGFDFDFDFDFHFDFDDAFSGVEWGGWDDAWDPWSDDPDLDIDF
jgi:HEAT repeat protein/beta-lactamase regulating signal transducer with metallopeptidase domain